jgi:pyruvate,orthophosphate dikinase
MNEASKTEQNKHLPTLESEMPEVYEQLREIRRILELHSRDMLDIEFTIQEGTLYMVQSRVGKRTATAALNIATDMLDDGIIDPPTAVMRLTPEQISQLLYPIVDPEAEKSQTPIARGLPAGPGGAVGEIVFTSKKAVEEARKGKRIILVREETSPEDIEGMRAAIGILTARGGMTSHAAIVTRGWGKCCIVGAEALDLDTNTMVLTIGERTFLEGEVFTLNGTDGFVYEGELPMADSTKNPRLQHFLELADEYRFLGVRANADTPEDAQVALDFGAEGIGLYRTEHMFYGADSDEPLFVLRKMILSKTEEERKKVLDELAPYVKENVKATMEVMNGLPITFRLLDPPLHEFVPQSKIGQQKLAMALGIEPYEVRSRVMSLDESNPMMGHRGARLHLTYPDIPRMQVKAIFQAMVELIQEGKDVKIEVMMPVIIGYQELRAMKKIVEEVYEEVREEAGIDFNYLFGTMMETPRACLRASDMAQDAEFFSFGTNDLTQMGFGFSRDDIEVFLPHYLNKFLLQNDPFLSIDKRGVGELMKVAIERGRATRENLKLGVCGEHGGNARSVEFFYQIGLDYVSCSPYRVPIARLAAAQAALKDKIHRRRAASL